MNLQFQDFISICRDAVIHHAPVAPFDRCSQLQTFRHLQLERGAEISTPNLGAIPSDARGAYFWSRKWHNAKYNPNSIAFEYPLLTTFEIYADISDMFGDGTNKSVRTIEISVLDAFSENADKGAAVGCAARTVNQIYFSTEDLLNQVLRYLGSVVFITSDDFTGTIPYLQQWLSLDRVPTNANVVYDLGNTISNANQSLRFQRVEFPTRRVYGTKTQITLPTWNCPPPIAFDNTTLVDFGVMGNEAGLKAC